MCTERLERTFEGIMSPSISKYSEDHEAKVSKGTSNPKYKTWEIKYTMVYHKVLHHQYRAHHT